MDKPYLQRKDRKIAVLDVFVDGVGIDPAVMQIRLSERLQGMGWHESRTAAIRRATTAWLPEDGAKAAKAKGAEAALLCTVRISAPEKYKDPKADDSKYASPSDPTATRREYYRRDESLRATDRGPAVRVEISIVDAGNAEITYAAEFKTHLKDADESELAEIVLKPLKDVD